MYKKIAETLKTLRKEKGFTTEYVTEILKQHGFTISASTIYGYENLHSRPNADIFVALCKIYGIKDINIFLGEAEQSEPNPTFGKYNSLNSSGKQKADEYITDLSEQKKYTTTDEEDRADKYNSSEYTLPPRRIAALGADGTKQITPPAPRRIT